MTGDTVPYLNHSLPLNERIRDLLGRMTLDEKISQMKHAADAIPRLGMPAYNYWGEALHGIGRNGRATVFPQAIGMAATWEPALIQRIADAIGDEARAKYHATLQSKGDTQIYQGLTFWSPNVNIFRDPRWGRGQETWGEDPFLTGEMGAAFVRGLQGQHPTYMKAAACAKHYAVHSGPESERHTFDALVSLRDLYDTYLPAFKKLVTEAHVEAVMGAYNRTNGEPCCASQLLLVDILRGQWGFGGHVVSDCGALTDIHATHHYTRDGAESAALALRMGCDIGCDTVYSQFMAEAIQRGLVSEAELDMALGRTLATRFKLGMFDPPEQVPFSTTALSVLGCEKHRQLAYEAALKSIVLLKNDNVLPISPEIRSLCVLGPNAASVDVLLGNYYGVSDSLTTFLEGIVGRVAPEVRVEYRVGTQLTLGNSNAVDWTVYVAADSDLTIACMGLSPLLEGEEGDAMLSSAAGDRVDIGLPAVQLTYLKKLAEAGAKIVLVLAAGSPITLEEVQNLVHAIVLVWYPGQEGGRALASILFGDESPSGKLPLSFPRSLEQLPAYTDYAMAGRTYRYMTDAPLYPFGFGLSYTRFAYSNAKLSQPSIAAGESVELHCMLSNTGTIAAEEVVQYYLSDLEASMPVPVCKLIGFERVRLQPGEQRQLVFNITPDMLSCVNEQGQSVLEAGQFRITIGGCSPGASGQEGNAAQPLYLTLNVEC